MKATKEFVFYAILALYVVVTLCVVNYSEKIEEERIMSPTPADVREGYYDVHADDTGVKITSRSEPEKTYSLNTRDSVAIMDHGPEDIDTDTYIYVKGGDIAIAKDGQLINDVNINYLFFNIYVSDDGHLTDHLPEECYDEIPAELYPSDRVTVRYDYRSEDYKVIAFR